MKLSQKIVLQASIPIIIVVSVVATLMNFRAQSLTEAEIAAFEERMLVAKRTVLSSYVSLAQASIGNLYDGAKTNDIAAKEKAVDILNGLTLDPDAALFVYDFNGNSLVHPKEPLQVGKNWWSLTDPNGEPYIQQFIRKARGGGGFQPHAWKSPESDAVRNKVSYVVALDKGGWVLGADIFVDDVLEQVRSTEVSALARFRQNAVVIGVLTVKALIIVFVTALVFGLHERRQADAKLKELTQRIVETQEEERGRVARELHDGISQILVSVKYALELARLRAEQKSDDVGDAIDSGAEGLHTAIREVRRISRDLRPHILDDLGLSPALESLAAEFSERTGIEVDISTIPFRRSLPTDAKTTLFRVAQEALTNIERHAHASHVSIRLEVARRGVELKIRDDGRGFEPTRYESDRHSVGGLGLRNMKERLAYHNGGFFVDLSLRGTTILARLPRNLLRDEPAPAKPQGETEELWNDAVEPVKN